MKRSCLPLLLLVLAGACGDEAATRATNGSNVVSDGQHTAEGDQPEGRRKFWEQLIMKEIRDNKGTVLALIPLPASWTIQSHVAKGEPTITGPNGIRVTDYPIQSFMDNYDPVLQQSYYQSGQRLRSMPGVEALIQEDFIPRMQSQGYQFLRQYEIPEISAMDRW